MAKSAPPRFSSSALIACWARAVSRLTSFSLMEPTSEREMARNMIPSTAMAIMTSRIVNPPARCVRCGSIPTDRWSGTNTLPRAILPTRAGRCRGHARQPCVLLRHPAQGDLNHPPGRRSPCRAGPPIQSCRAAAFEIKRPPDHQCPCRGGRVHSRLERPGRVE